MNCTNKPTFAVGEKIVYIGKTARLSAEYRGRYICPLEGRKLTRIIVSVSGLSPFEMSVDFDKIERAGS